MSIEIGQTSKSCESEELVSVVGKLDKDPPIPEKDGEPSREGSPIHWTDVVLAVLLSSDV